jgi:hypothetical protein
VLGKGFVLSPEEAAALIVKDQRNKDVLFPYLNGDDLNNDPEQKPSRWVINFFDWSEEKARTYPDCFEILENRVKPERQRWKLDEDGNEIIGEYALRKPLPEKWWVYGEKRPGLYKTISQLDQVMAINRHAKYLLISIMPKGIVYSEATVILAIDSYVNYSILSSSIHDVWAWKNSSTMGAATLRYSTSKSFETLPFPENILSKNALMQGVKLRELRLKIMNRFNLGLTDVYNFLHSPKLIEDDLKVEILSLRTCHCVIDELVLELYDWGDIKLKHDFYELEHLPESDRVRFTIHPTARKELLKRLLQLNHDIHSISESINEDSVKSIQNFPSH